MKNFKDHKNKKVILTVAAFVCGLITLIFGEDVHASDHGRQAYLAPAAYVTLIDGTVITVPEGGKGCEYHKDYCFMGYIWNGTFPGVQLANAINAQLDALDPNQPACVDMRELVVSPAPPGGGC